MDEPKYMGMASIYDTKRPTVFGRNRKSEGGGLDPAVCVFIILL